MCFMFCRVWGVPGGFPEVQVIILDMWELYMMVSGFMFDVFLMIEVWKSDLFTDLDLSKLLPNGGQCPEEWWTFGTHLVLDSCKAL